MHNKGAKISPSLKHVSHHKPPPKCMDSTHDIPWYPRFHSFKCASPQATTSQACKCKVD